MNKRVKILIAAASFIFVGAVILTALSLRQPESTCVEIVQDNKVIYSIDLAKEKDRSFRVEYEDGGWNEIRIAEGKISISDSDCPDKTCIKTGALRWASVPIVCLPHRLVIRFADKEQS